jgi:hypothetical protein
MIVPGLIVPGLIVPGLIVPASSFPASSFPAFIVPGLHRSRSQNLFTAWPLDCRDFAARRSRLCRLM